MHVVVLYIKRLLNYLFMQRILESIDTYMSVD